MSEEGWDYPATVERTREGERKVKNKGYKSNRDIPRPSRTGCVVAVAASAGGIRALKEIFTALPESFPAAIVVVQHLAPHQRSLLAEILSRHTTLKVKQAEGGEKLKAGTAYIAPPDRHLLVNSDATLSLTQTELVHFVRPSADLLFESVAASYREGAIAVVLTGTGSDGSMGVQAIKKMGGTVIVQDEKSSEFFGMPDAAIKTGDVDFVLPLSEIPSTLVSLVMGAEKPYERTQ